jgi:hypothetical protein
LEKKTNILIKKQSATSSDLDSIRLFLDVQNVRRQTNWIAGNVTLTEADIKHDLDELNLYEQAAVTAE